jgi:hypothetical protein
MLSAIFHSYVRKSATLCLYQVGDHYLAPKLVFPHVQTLALIHCSRNGVQNVLTPSRFPNVKTVHYLSAHPGQVDLYRRFPSNIDWVFPNSKYIFYKCMIDAGIGRVDPQIISRYVYRVLDNDIHIKLPGYGIYIGKHYRTHMNKYLEREYMPSKPLVSPFVPINEDDDEETVVSKFLREQKDIDFFNRIMNTCNEEDNAIMINHLDATPFHNSSK